MTLDLTIEYLVKVIEDNVVDSLLNHSQIPLIVSLPSPLRERSRPATYILSSVTKTRSYWKLYDLTPSSTPSTMVKESS